MNLKYITRPESDNVSGYQVRLPECSNGEVMPNTKETRSRMFSFSHYKTESSCLTTAIKWRNAYLKKHECMWLLKQKSSLDRAFTVSRRNTSGAIGIQCQTTVRESGNLHRFYLAMWVEEVTVKGKRKRVMRTNQRSTDKYGECEAFQMVCRIRFEKKGVIIITNPKTIPCYPDVPYIIKE